MKMLLSTLTTRCQTVSLSLRWQMVVWYTTAFTVLLVFTGAVFYQYLEHSLEASVDTDLQLRAQQIADGAIISHGTVRLRNVTGDLPGFGVQPQNVPPEPSDVNYGVLVRLLDA